jgi:hypothetical protein
VTGPEFAKNHGNDSSTWSSADFETQINLVLMDFQPTWRLAHPEKAAAADQRQAAQAAA